jgi:hypothetical protein
MITYGFTIKWGHNSFGVSNQPTAEEAQRVCIEWATKHGWTPPKWWQWWRWGDTKLPQSFAAKSPQEK